LGGARREEKDIWRGKRGLRNGEMKTGWDDGDGMGCDTGMWNGDGVGSIAAVLNWQAHHFRSEPQP